MCGKFLYSKNTIVQTNCIEDLIVSCLNKIMTFNSPKLHNIYSLHVSPDTLRMTNHHFLYHLPFTYYTFKQRSDN